MDLRKIKKLIELLEESDLMELEIHEGEESVRLTRYAHQNTVPIQYAPQQLSAVVPVTAESALTAAAAIEEKASSNRHTLHSPMVGTFYRATSPGATPLADIGQTVTVGDAVCVIEAMKNFNQIDADVAGTIVDVLVENGYPVEYDQPLFIIEKQ